MDLMVAPRLMIRERCAVQKAIDKANVRRMKLCSPSSAYEPNAKILNSIRRRLPSSAKEKVLHDMQCLRRSRDFHPNMTKTILIDEHFISKVFDAGSLMKAMKANDALTAAVTLGSLTLKRVCSNNLRMSDTGHE